jgi:DNA repair exonuclease SbcCD ATPase subunit
VMEEIRGLEGRLKEIGYDEDEHERVREEEKRKGTEVERLKGDMDGVKKVIEEKVRRLRMVEGEMGKVRDIEEKLRRAEAAFEVASGWEMALQAAQGELREDYISEINGALALIWPIIYPYTNLTGERVRATEEDYYVELESNGEWIPVQGRVSGGEKTCAALALRIAFAMVLVPNLSWLFLDEPTHNLDDEEVEALARTLREEVPKVVEQTIVITHDKRLMAGGGRAYLLSSKEGRSVVRRAMEENK